VRTLDQPRRVFRRQPVRIIAGEPEGGYTNAFEIICCDCGDDPGLDYRDVSPELQRVRGPYPLRPALGRMRSTSRSTSSTNDPYESGPPGGCPVRQRAQLGDGPPAGQHQGTRRARIAGALTHHPSVTCRRRRRVWCRRSGPLCPGRRLTRAPLRFVATGGTPGSRRCRADAQPPRAVAS
jgi:hypothetical protein